MRISTKGRYGVRIMMELANRYGEGPVLVGDIEKSQEISGKYIHVLVGGLRAAGLIRAARGRYGGYTLTRDPSSITLLDVVSSLEGGSAPVECVADASACGRSGHCAARDVWCDIAAAIDGVLSGITLAQLASQQRKKSREIATYSI